MVGIGRIAVAALMGPVLLGLAGCGAETGAGSDMGEVPPASLYAGEPEGGWPVLGQVSGTLGGAPVAWETYDFSVGAYDASAWFAQRDGNVVLTITGYPPGQSDARDGLLRVEAVLAGAPAAGVATAGVRAGIVNDRDWASPVLSDPAAAMTLTGVTRDGPAGSSGYGRVSGTITADLCDAAGACRALAVTFDTEAQFDGL